MDQNKYVLWINSEVLDVGRVVWSGEKVVYWIGQIFNITKGSDSLSFIIGRWQQQQYSWILELYLPHMRAVSLEYELKWMKQELKK